MFDSSASRPMQTRVPPLASNGARFGDALVLISSGIACRMCTSTTKSYCPRQSCSGFSKSPATHDSVNQRLHYVHQEGRAVFKVAVTKMAEVSLSVLETHGFGVNDIDLFVPHQANGRIITATADRMNLPSDKAFVNVDRYANTTNATIPIALSEASDTGRLASGDLVQLTAFGGGYTWGSVLLRWGTVHDG